MATNKLHAILRGKSAIAIMALSYTDRYLDIEVEGDVENGQQRKRNEYSVQLSVADTVVAKSTRSSGLKWEWNANNHMWVGLVINLSVDVQRSPSGISWFEPSSTMKVEVYRGLKGFNFFNKLVGQYQGKVEDLLDNSEYNVRYIRVFVLKKI